jgi:ATP-dependent RNA helicase DeaD
VPQSSEAYVHRIGRVGRAGREGVAITLVPPSKMYALRNVEKLTGQPIEIAPVPTAADLRAARLERTRIALEESVVEGSDVLGEVEDVRAMLAGLAAEHDLLDVATAAVRLLQSAAGAPDDGEDIPVVSAGRARGERSERPVKGRGAGSRPPKSGMTRLFVNAGRAGGVRPQDIVGALANESNLSGRDIGAIQIHERHALVEVPEHAADDVLRSLRGSTTLKGRRANVRRDRDFAGAGRGRS